MPAAKKYRIAIMDEEARERDKFVLFFEDDFEVIEIPFVESVDKLIDIIKSENIDAIAIDYKLKEHNSRFTKNGDFFFKELMARLHDFPSFVMTQDAATAKRESKLIKPRFIIDKKILHSKNKAEIKSFKSDIRTEIKTFKDQFAEKLKRVKELQKLRKTGALTANLENEFLELNNEISLSLTGYSLLPLKYFSQETNAKLDAVIAKTDALIQKIATKKK